MEARIAEAAALIIVLLSMLEGAHKGFLLKLYSMVRLILLLVLTVLLVPILSPVILALLPGDFAGREGVVFLTAIVISAVAVGIIGSVLGIVDHIPVINTLNKLGGALTGLVCGVIFVWVLLLAISTFREVSWCHEIYRCIRKSELLMAVQHFNPIQSILKNLSLE